MAIFTITPSYAGPSEQMGASVMFMPRHPHVATTWGWRNLLGLLVIALTSYGAEAKAEGPRLGQVLSPNEAAATSIHVFPDGKGLPHGGGSVIEGKKLYEEKCASCHGNNGSGGSAEELQGRSPLSGEHPDKTIGNYWPYATTIFDYIRRAMPINAPRSLDNDQVYALTAYLLFINGIISENTKIDAQTLPSIRMPNQDGFVRMWPEKR